ncbi:hypothetical protein [Periweissella ghanensis]|uniref:Uncharacterized protein n=1 Tax=Periweissella ghanensis TaxID=467997 RepID=A0ABM8Z9U1_9LACO|nr:hypothetical protein [Periweissella ghanensis]MCM0600450.1 hypothetical protein [Periweissella ghanensis]CAH0418086.1 hypothetical protein WGH24286_00502 [Periweissella ghanensis]
MPAQSIEAISAENQHLQQQLNPESEHYYHCFAQYLDENGAFCRPHALADHKREVLRQIVNAQKTEYDCQTYFTMSAVELAQKHLEQTPHSGRSYTKAWLLFALAFAFPQMLGPEHTFDFGGTILFMVLASTAAYLICRFFAQTKDVFQGLLGWGLVCLTTIFNLALALQVHTPVVYHLSGATGMISLALIALIAVLLDPISGYQNSFDRVVLVLAINNSILGMLVIIINTVTLKEGINPLNTWWIGGLFAIITLISTIAMWRLIKYVH